MGQRPSFSHLTGYPEAVASAQDFAPYDRTDGDLSRIGYALGGTSARLGVLCLCSPPDPSLSGTIHLTTHRRGLASGRAAGQRW